MDAYPINAFPIHVTHSTAPNIDPAIVEAWKRDNGYFICERRNLGLSAAECKRMRKEALSIKRKHVKRYGNIVWPTNDWQRAKMCATCREYAR